MKYDFETIIKRAGKDAIALDGIGDPGNPTAPNEGFDVIPMWIADQNFPVVPSIQNALLERLKHPTFGYFSASQEYYDSIFKWHKDSYNVSDFDEENISFHNGVLGGVISGLNIFCSKGDNVLVHTPIYNGYVNTLSNNGYNMIFSPLIKDKDGVWRIDYEDMEKKIIENNINVSIFCSPHNPTGRVWEQSELERVMELYQKHDVFVISDEIWSELVLYQNKHIPTQSISEDAKMRTISLYSASKTFNIAGITGSYAITYNPWITRRYNKEASLSHYNNQTVFSMHAIIGAYSEEGREWKDELIKVIESNVDYACHFINNEFEGLNVSKPDGTYVIFVDCKDWMDNNNLTIDEMLKKCWDVGVSIEDGRKYLSPTFIRINLALPKQSVIEAFDRLKKYVFI